MHGTTAVRAWPHAVVRAGFLALASALLLAASRRLPRGAARATRGHRRRETRVELNCRRRRIQIDNHRRRRRR